MTWPGVSTNERNVDRSSTEKLSVEAHERSDVDAGLTAQHHTLGIGPGQGSPGDHIHDGRTSRKLVISASNVTGLGPFISAYINANPTIVTNIVTPTYVLNIIQANPSTVAGYIRSHMLAVFFSGSRNSDAWRVLVMTAFTALGCTNSTSA